MISAILAISDNNAIGNNQALPWPHIKEDMQWFQKITTDNVVVMGKKTWSSLGVIKPLKNRVNYIITNSVVEGADGFFNGDVQHGLKMLESRYNDKEIFVIGGANVYNQAFQACDRIYVCRVFGEYDADTFLDLDPVLEDFDCIEATDVPGVCQFQTWERK